MIIDRVSSDMYSLGEGSRTIVNADSNFVLFCNLFDSDDIAKAYGVTILSKLVGYGELSASWAHFCLIICGAEITGHIVKHAGVIELLRKFAQDPDSKVQDSSADLLGKIAKYCAFNVYLAIGSLISFFKMGLYPLPLI